MSNNNSTTSTTATTATTITDKLASFEKLAASFLESLGDMTEEQAEQAFAEISQQPVLTEEEWGMLTPEQLISTAGLMSKVQVAHYDKKTARYQEAAARHQETADRMRRETNNMRRELIGKARNLKEEQPALYEKYRKLGVFDNLKLKDLDDLDDLDGLNDTGKAAAPSKAGVEVAVVGVTGRAANAAKNDKVVPPSAKATLSAMTEEATTTEKKTSDTPSKASAEESSKKTKKTPASTKKSKKTSAPPTDRLTRLASKPRTRSASERRAGLYN